MADLDLIEINEAFASVGIQSTKDLGVSPDIVNVNGGAIALGHPIGMSGARLVLTLALELRRRGGGIGAAALCGGGGQGDALIIKVPRRHDLAVLRPAARPSRRGAAAHRDVPALVDGAREGDPRAVARLVTLVEDGDRQPARDRRRARAVHRSGTGHRPDRLARAWASRP